MPSTQPLDKTCILSRPDKRRGAADTAPGMAQTGRRFEHMKRTLAVVAAATFFPAGIAQATTITNLPKPPAQVLRVADAAQASICATQGTCITVDAPSPNCLPLGRGIRSWVCQGGVKTTTGTLKVCAVDTFTSPKGTRHRVLYTCTKTR